MLVTGAVLVLCLDLVTSAPTVGDRSEENAITENASPPDSMFADLGSSLDVNNTSPEDDDYALISGMLNDILEDYDTMGNGTDFPSTNGTHISSMVEDTFSLDDRIMSGDSASKGDVPNPMPENDQGASETPVTSSATTTEERTATSTAQQAPASEDNASANRSPSPANKAASSSTSSSSSAEEDDYDYYDYSAVYGDYSPPTAFPFNMFDDVVPRPPAKGDVLPSSCAWAVVHCCDNPDKLGSRVSCFSHVGCYGSWFQDFCTPELKKVVFKSVFKSFNFSP